MADEVSQEQFERFKESSSIFDDDDNGKGDYISPFTTPFIDSACFTKTKSRTTFISGFITPEELAAVIGSFDCRPSEEELREMIEEIDANRDGILEFVEFFNGMASKVKVTHIFFTSDMTEITVFIPPFFFFSIIKKKKQILGGGRYRGRAQGGFQSV